MTQTNRDLREEVKLLAIELQAAIDSVPRMWESSSIFADIVDFATNLHNAESCRLVRDSWDAAVGFNRQDRNREKLSHLFAAANSLCYAVKNANELETSLKANMREPTTATLHATYLQKFDTMAEIARRHLRDFWAIQWNSSQTTPV